MNTRTITTSWIQACDCSTYRLWIRNARTARTATRTISYLIRSRMNSRHRQITYYPKIWKWNSAGLKSTSTGTFVTSERISLKIRMRCWQSTWSRTCMYIWKSNRMYGATSSCVCSWGHWGTNNSRRLMRQPKITNNYSAVFLLSSKNNHLTVFSGAKRMTST